MGFKDNTKQWFKTALKPTQAQFWQTFEWLRWKDEQLSVAEVDGLEAALALKADADTVTVIGGINLPQILTLIADGTYIIPIVRLLEKMIIIPTADIELTIGTTPGGNDIISALPFTSGEEKCIDLNIPSIGAAKTIYLSGITASTKFYIYTR